MWRYKVFDEGNKSNLHKVAIFEYSKSMKIMGIRKGMEIPMCLSRRVEKNFESIFEELKKTLSVWLRESVNKTV